MATGSAAETDGRVEHRHEILFRTRAAGADGRWLPVTLVNISPHGFMARTEAAHAAGDPVILDLPIVGTVVAEIRWALGGRIGCRLAGVIALDAYPPLLHALVRGDQPDRSNATPASRSNR